MRNPSSYCEGNVSAVKAEVGVKDFIVILRDDAATRAGKTLATKYADDVDGFKILDIDFHKKIFALLQRGRTCFGRLLSYC